MGPVTLRSVLILRAFMTLRSYFHAAGMSGSESNDSIRHGQVILGNEIVLNNSLTILTVA